MTIEERALNIARETARTAGQKILPLFGKVSQIREKESPTDICSEADLLAEKIIFSRLSPEFPDFNYLSEERQFIDKGSGYTWVINYNDTYHYSGCQEVDELPATALTRLKTRGVILRTSST